MDVSDLGRGSYGVICVTDGAGNVLGPWYLETNIGRFVMIFSDLRQLREAITLAERHYNDPDHRVAVAKFTVASPVQVRQGFDEAGLHFVSEGEEYFDDLLEIIRKENATSG